MRFAYYCLLLRAAIGGDSGIDTVARYPAGGGVVCTMEAKVCPNGRSVGRQGPNCEFAPCDGSSSYPIYPYWPSNPIYPGTGGYNSCSSHSQCSRGQYCYSCSVCLGQYGCSVTSTCRLKPYGGECAPIANCFRDQDPIDGACPGSSGNVNACAAVTCPYGQRCVPEPKQCFTTPCPQYRCEYGGVSPINACAAVACPWGQTCVEEPKACVRAPCPQYRCQDNAVSPTSPCSGVTCPYGQRCVSEPKQCFTTPCPQYSCQSVSGGFDPCSPNPCSRNQRCVKNDIFCIRAPCPQYTCVGGGSSDNCGVNEEYETCGSSSCWENTCSNTGPWPPQACTSDCRQGCRCKNGYKRGYDGVCTATCFF